MRPRVGILGLGSMGSAVAARLSARGIALAGYDRDPAARARFSELAGAAVAASASELAAGSDILITLLPDGGTVTQALAGESGVLASLRPSTLVVDMGSSNPTGTRALGRLLAERGVELLDAPISGGVARARRGELTVMVGGDPEAMQRADWLLEAISSRVVRTGDLGSAHAMKALNNLLSAAALVATAETMLIGLRLGLDPRTMLEVFNSSTGRNNSTENKIEQFVLSGTFDSGFGLALMAKDVHTALELARDAGATTPVSSACEAIWSQAAAASPPGEDHTAIVRWVESLSVA